MMLTTTFISVEEVKEVLGVSNSKAYHIIRDFNAELSEKGFMVVAGRESRQYFNERFYGLKNVEEED